MFFSLILIELKSMKHINVKVFLNDNKLYAPFLDQRIAYLP